MSGDPPSDRTYASFYDFYDGPDGRGGQFEMYRSLAAECQGPVLELGCGTGIITFDLARSGFQVTGLDISKDMLEVASGKLDHEPADVRGRVRLVQGNMADFDLGERFGAIFIPTNTFGYLAKLEERRSCLEAIRRHLKEEGLLVIEERQYTPDLLARMRDQQCKVMQWTSGVNAATGRYTSFNSTVRHVDLVTQTVYERSWVDEVQEDGTVKRHVRQPPAAGDTLYPWEVRHYFTPLELQLLIEQAGFAIRPLRGGPSEHPLTSDSRNMIFVAEKTG